MKLLYLLPCLFLLFQTSCNHRVDLTDLEVVPRVSRVDSSLAGVFTMLDGTWKGIFRIYKDQKRIMREEIQLEFLDSSDFHRPGLELTEELVVTQTYWSETPFFQRVQIQDYYPRVRKEVKSHGINKVQQGQLWCVVQKPSELILHQGTLIGKDTIIWRSSEQNPEKEEFFQEWVGPVSYEIMGWGYYAGDDRNLSPPFWFRGTYQRQTASSYE